MSTIAANLQTVRDQVAVACEAAHRPPSSVRLLAVSKTFGAQAVAQCHAAGQRAFGENYIQEAVDKIAQCTAAGLQGIEWHCIGPVQSNKTRLVAQHFDWVHTVDRLKVAQRLSEQRPAHLPPLNVCIQVNVDAGPTKAGVLPSDALALASAVAQLPRLCLRGVMSIPDPVYLADGVTLDFVATKHRHDWTIGIFEQFLAHFGAAGAAWQLDTVSAGMSSDLGPAVAAGSTMVRVGSAIFGQRATKT
jgi:PLP dependent protein